MCGWPTLKSCNGYLLICHELYVEGSIVPRQSFLENRVKSWCRSLHRSCRPWKEPPDVPSELVSDRGSDPGRSRWRLTGLGTKHKYVPWQRQNRHRDDDTQYKSKHLGY